MDEGLLVDRHARYFMRFLTTLPSSLAAHDTTRLTIAYFALSGLDVLGRLGDLPETLRRDLVEWIYRLQAEDGFEGSTATSVGRWRRGHLTMTYTGLCCLLVLGDDLSRVDRAGIARAMRRLQTPAGDFSAALAGTESDMRFLYCAACVCHILDDWSGFDADAAERYVLDSSGYDSGFGQAPGLESHGGTTYCAVATLLLAGRLDALPPARLEALRRWSVARQTDGFQGRPNKPADTCYSFWVGATLRMLGSLELTDLRANAAYVLDAQDPAAGGLSKWPSADPDPLHTYLGLGGLSLAGAPRLEPVSPALNVTRRATERLRELHESWRAAQ